MPLDLSGRLHRDELSCNRSVVTAILVTGGRVLERASSANLRVSKHPYEM